MAILAMFSELSLVRVPAMAIAAIGKSDLPVFLTTRMAANAGHGIVFSPQRKPGQFMVESGRLPGSLLMAGAAVFSECRPMRIGVAIAAAGEGKAFPALVRVT